VFASAAGIFYYQAPYHSMQLGVSIPTATATEQEISQSLAATRYQPHYVGTSLAAFAAQAGACVLHAIGDVLTSLQAGAGQLELLKLTSCSVAVFSR
jgi:hypothetical protein